MAAQTAIKNANRDTAIAIENGLRDQMAARAALNAQIKEDLLQETAAVKAAADAQKAAIVSAAAEEAAAQKESKKAISDAGQTLGNLAQALKIPALVGAIGFAAVAAIGVGFAAGIADIGIKAADATRSATLGFESMGLSAKDAAVEVRQLQDLADKGLNLTNLVADAGALNAIGVTAQGSTTLLNELADAFAAAGAVGATLQTDVDGAASALASLAERTNITTKTFGTAVLALGLPVTVVQTYQALEKELGLTSKQLDALFAKGKVTGAEVANAALAATVAAGSGGLNNALNQSPTQAIASLKSSVEDALGAAFSAPGVAQGILKIRDALVKSLGAVSGDVSKFASDALAGIAKFIPLAVEGLNKLIPFVQRVFDFIVNEINQANTKGTSLNKFVTDLIKDIQDLDKILTPFLSGFVSGVGGIVEALKPLLDLLSKIAGTDAGSNLFKAAGGIAAVALAGKGIAGLKGLLDGLAASLTGVAGAEDAAAASAKTLAADTGAAATGLEAEAGGAAAAGGAGGLAGRAAAGGVLGAAGLGTLAGAAGGLAGISPDKIDTITKSLDKTVLSTKDYATALEGLGGQLKGASTDEVNYVRNTLEANGETERYKGSIDAAQAAINNYNTSHAINENTALSASSVQTAADVNNINGTPTVNINPALNALGALDAAALQSASIVAAALNSAPSSGAPGTNELNGGGLSGSQIDREKQNAPGIAAAGAAAAAAAAAKAAADAAAKAAQNPFGPVPQGSSGPSAAQTAASAAKTKLDNATKAFKASLKNFTDALASPQTRADIDNAITQLQNTINNFDSALGKTEPKGLKTLVSKYNAELRTLGNQLQAVNDQLAAATQATAASITQTLGTGSLTDIFTALSSSVTTATVDLSRLTLVLPGALKTIVAPPVNTADAFQKALDAKVKAAQDFQANITKLQKEGLSAGVLSDLINGGVAASGATAAQLATETPAQIDAINKSEAALNKVAQTIGSSAGDAAAAAAQNIGESVVAGLVTGLQTKDKALQDAAKALGKTISDAVKKELKIKSPSLVMHGLGVHAGTGLAHGLLSTHSAITGAASRLALAAMPDIGARPGMSGITHGATGVTTHNNQREIHAPITVYNYGSPDSSGERVGAAIGRLVIR